MATDFGTAGGKTKGKKNKGTKLDINDLVDPNSFKMVDSWADEMENEEIRVPVVNLPTAPKATTTGSDIDIDSVPHHPPFKAHVSNISFDSNQSHLEKFFSNSNLVKVSMGNEGGRPTGNAYVEFENRKDLINALLLNGKMLGNRPLKIHLTNMSDRGGFNAGGGGGRRTYQDNTPSNWRSREGLPPKNVVAPPPTAPEFEGRSAGGGFGVGFRNNYGGSGGGGSSSFNRNNDSYGRKGEDGGFMRRDRYGDDGGNWQARGQRENANDSGESEANWRTAPRPPPPEPQRNDFRSNDRGDRFGGEREGGYRNDRRDDYGQRGFDRRDNNNMNRNNYQNDRPQYQNYDRQNSNEDQRQDRHALAPSQAVPAPKEKLDMKEIFQSISQVEDEKPVSYSSIFGGAKPVDTVQKELEIERKLAEAAQKKEAEAEALKKEAETVASSVADKSNISDNASVHSEQASQRSQYQRDDRGPREGPPRQRRENGRDDNRTRRYDDRSGASGAPRRFDGERNGERMYRRNDRDDRGSPRDGPPRDGLRKDGYNDRSGRGYNNRPRDGPSDRYYNKSVGGHRGDHDGAPRRQLNDYHGNDDDFLEKNSNTNYIMNNKFSTLGEQ